MTPWVLASASPRRFDLLGRFDHPFTVDVADIDETARPNETPRSLVERLARTKAATVAQRHATATVIGADTIVVGPKSFGHPILGKPANADDAAAALRMLSGQTHTVLTAVAVVSTNAAQSPEPTVRSTVVETIVRFDDLTDESIAAYVASGEPFDAAGSYKIQGHAGRFVAAIEGPFDNVVGLPLVALADLLEVRPPSPTPAPQGGKRAERR